MVTFTKNPYDWADDKDINSAVLKLDMSYKGAPIPADSVQNGLGVTVPTRLSVDPKSFTNATLSNKNHHTAVISLKRVSPASVLILYVYVGKMTPEDFDHFNDLNKVSLKRPLIFSGYVNMTLYHGNGSDALDALELRKFYEFTPVWLYNFRFAVDSVCFNVNSSLTVFTHANDSRMSKGRFPLPVYTAVYTGVRFPLPEFTARVDG